MSEGSTRVVSCLGSGPRTCALLLCALPLACGADAASVHEVGELDYDGRVERIETLGHYSSLEASLLLQLAGGNAVSDHGYTLYRVIYSTLGAAGDATRVSGLLGVPETRNLKGVVSWQHGTNTYRPESISKPSLPEGLGLAALFASDGYVFVAADYVGLGVSREMHPYYHWPVIVGSVLDLLEIAQIVVDGITLGDAPGARDLYLAGFSEGGGATAAVQRELQAHNPTGLRLRAAAPIAGAFDPLGVSMAHALKTNNVLHFGYLLAALSSVHQEPLAPIVRPPYDKQLPKWFDGEHGQAFLDEHLPKHMGDLLTEQFLADFEAGREEPAWFYAAMRAAQTSDYVPEAPLRLHYGTEDNVVIPREAKAAFERMLAAGGNVELVNVGPYDHENIVVHSVGHIQRWFDELEQESK